MTGGFDVNNLEKIRRDAGMNMREAARGLEIPYTTYVSWEKGDREPNSEMLIKLAEFFDTTIDYLIGRTDDPEGADTQNAPAETGRRAPSEDDIKFALFGGSDDITDAMYQEVMNFAAFVKKREDDKKK